MYFVRGPNLDCSSVGTWPLSVSLPCFPVTLLCHLVTEGEKERATERDGKGDRKRGIERSLPWGCEVGQWGDSDTPNNPDTHTHTHSPTPVQFILSLTAAQEVADLTSPPTGLQFFDSPVNHHHAQPPP